MDFSPCASPRKRSRNSGTTGNEASRPSSAAEDARTASRERGVMRQLWQLYEDVVLPLEQRSFFEHFHAPRITAEEFSARPQVLLLGQYSTGKTSMVKWLTGSENTHFDVRPQPSTDKFMAVVHGEQERLIHGNAATCLPQLPYQGLSVFGANFLSSFQALALPADILKEITFIDTPGVLSGSKQRIGRDYEFSSICAWMADRADLVLLTFDAHKLDISDEFQEVMNVLRPYTDKVRCVLNKADQIDASNLVRVYGALLWNVGKVLRSPEVARVFVSSFWTEEYRFKDHQQLFDEDKDAILKELRELPRTSLLRKINSFVARVRRVRALLCVVACIRDQLPWIPMLVGGNERLRRWVDENLERLFKEAQRSRNLSSGDMPKIDDFRGRLASFDHVKSLPKFDSRDIARLDAVINTDVPDLINKVGGVSTSQLSCMEADASPSPSRWGLLGRLGIGDSRKRRKIDP